MSNLSDIYHYESTREEHYRALELEPGWPALRGKQARRKEPRPVLPPPRDEPTREETERREDAWLLSKGVNWKGVGNDKG